MRGRGGGRLRMGGAALIVAVLVARLCLDSSTGARMLHEAGPMVLLLFCATAVVALFAAAGLPAGEQPVARTQRRLRRIDHGIAHAATRKKHQAVERGRLFLN